MRRKAPDEIHIASYRKGLTHTCTNCLQQGHNRGKCKNPTHSMTKLYKVNAEFSYSTLLSFSNGFLFNLQENIATKEGQNEIPEFTQSTNALSVPLPTFPTLVVAPSITQSVGKVN